VRSLIELHLLRESEQEEKAPNIFLEDKLLIESQKGFQHYEDKSKD